jgi:carbon monoxide dehydrogenase subunit G
VNTISIDGPVAVAEFFGDVKELAMALPYVAAAWMTGDKTFVAVKMKVGTIKRHAEQDTDWHLKRDMKQSPERVHFSPTGCDVAFIPNCNN